MDAYDNHPLLCDRKIQKEHLSFPFWFYAVPYDRKTRLIPGSFRRHKSSKQEDLTSAVAYKKRV